MFYFLLHVCEVIRSFIVVLEVIFVIFYKLLIIFLLFQNMDMAVSVPEVAEEVEISSPSVLPVEAAVPGPHLYEQALFVNFCKAMLIIDPDSRLSASEALEHPWILWGENLTEVDIKYPSA